MIQQLNIHEVRRALWGKSHYYDQDMMRFFNSRLLSAYQYEDDSILSLESCRMGGWNHQNQRFYRWVFHDKSGSSILGPEVSRSTAHRQIQKMLWLGRTDT